AATATLTSSMSAATSTGPARAARRHGSRGGAALHDPWLLGVASSPTARSSAGSARATLPGAGSEGAVEAPFDDLAWSRRVAPPRDPCVRPRPTPAREVTRGPRGVR